jgi:HEPN domain-containing protein
MVQEAARKTNKIAQLLDEARELDLHYIPSRYPNGLPSGYPHQFYGKNTADKALMAAEKVFVTIRDSLIANGGEDIVESDER